MGDAACFATKDYLHGGEMVQFAVGRLFFVTGLALSHEQRYPNRHR